MLHGNELQLAWRPEDSEIFKPLTREFVAEGMTEAVKQFMRDQGLDRYSYGLGTRIGGAA
jgi:hypothetical protein